MGINTAFSEAIGNLTHKAPDHSTNQRRLCRTKLSIREHFEIFDRENPWVYKLLVSYSYELLNAGHRHCGIALVFERLRWQMMIETHSLGAYKLNNNLRALYARKIMDCEPGLKDFFRLRSLRSH